MDWNWLCDQTPRVARTIREVVEEVVEEVKDGIPTEDDMRTIWRKIRAALNRALIPHPVAHEAVLRELEVEFVPNGG